MDLDPYSFAPKYPERAREFFRGGGVRAWPQHPRSFSVDDLAELEEVYRRHRHLRSNEEYKESGIIIEVEGEYRLCPWLEWTDESSLDLDTEQYFSEVFPEYESFRYEPIYIHDAFEEPEYPILSAYFLIGRDTIKLSDEETGKLSSFYNELRVEYTEGARIPARNIPALTALRDSFETQIRRYAAYVSDVHMKIQNVLRVVAGEAESTLLATARKMHKELDQSSLWNYARRQVHFHTRRVWRGIQWGYPL